MSVFTSINSEQLETFLRGYTVGGLRGYQGIDEGVENTNYFVSTDDGEYVLTIFEHHSHDELTYFLDLLAHLAEAGLPTAHPLPDRQGHYLRSLADKPAAILQRMPGASLIDPQVRHCKAIGEVLGRMHNATRDFTGFRHFDRGPDWWRETADLVMPGLGAAEQRLLREELDYQLDQWDESLPAGVIHADLFRDNVLFESDKPSGILDFYFACNHFLLYDLAVTVNDWCLRSTGELDQAKVQSLIGAYHSVRPLEQAELGRWPVMLRCAALRFWLSRLRDKAFPRPGLMIKVKDPNDFRRLLEHHINFADKSVLGLRI